MKQIWSLMYSPTDGAGAAANRSTFEQFAVPHMFQPKLTVAGAVISVLGALARMFLGSLLFAVWGAYSFLAWQEIRHPLARAALAIASPALFLAAFAGLMIAINISLKKFRG
jgi:hypothetical protein